MLALCLIDASGHAFVLAQAIWHVLVLDSRFEGITDELKHAFRLWFRESL